MCMLKYNAIMIHVLIYLTIPIITYIYLCVCIYTRDIIYGHEVMEGVGYGWGQKKVTRVRECFVLKHKRGKFVKNVFDHFVSYAFAFFKKGPLKVNLIENSIIS